ncbi:hypothetical protein VNO78_19746 [Psophocarpus tetragonolobus]|uniref:PPPDE domain-containing protein n=1 Tax=Psophocarpus tetragonolobus TaxID=3891 RepID=A0AAN9SCH9_PSOTE
MAKVRVHIYDVTNGTETKNRTIFCINTILYTIGFGGVFHSAVQVYGDKEWSFGFCDEEDTAVYSYPARQSKTYKYRTSLVQGKTKLNASQVKQILNELSREWTGDSYHPLSKNCNHFSDEFCARLGVPKLPGWVNRFANAGDAACEGFKNTSSQFRKAKTHFISASKAAYQLFFDVTNNVELSADSPSNSNRGGSPGVQAALLKSFSTRSLRRSSTGKWGEVEPRKQTRKKNP